MMETAPRRRSSQKDDIPSSSIIMRDTSGYSILKGVCADVENRRTFVTAASELGLKVDISEGIKPNEWRILSKRWWVEHTFGWMNHTRRLSKDYEMRTNELLLGIVNTIDIF
ncbi:hypothetical protein [Ethanoligenens sp.]|uniref:hypothetical protein n=1 Tax=Ethanoligenens sp. TaxID=2099655 RepID=UPI0039E7D640